MFFFHGQVVIYTNTPINPWLVIVKLRWFFQCSMVIPSVSTVSVQEHVLGQATVLWDRGTPSVGIGCWNRRRLASKRKTFGWVVCVAWVGHVGHRCHSHSSILSDVNFTMITIPGSSTNHTGIFATLSVFLGFLMDWTKMIFYLGYSLNNTQF